MAVASVDHINSKAVGNSLEKLINFLFFIIGLDRGLVSLRSLPRNRRRICLVVSKHREEILPEQDIKSRDFLVKI